MPVKCGKRILVIGLGQIGYSNAEYMTSKGLEADGYDISEGAIERALGDGVIRKAAKDFEGYDYYVICVSTHDPEDISKPSIDGLYETAKKLSSQGKGGALVAIESTVTRGASSRVKEILGHRLHVAHVPHRFYVLEKEDHGVRQTRVLGGCEPCCLREAKGFYKHILDIPVHIVSSVDIAELSKIVENSYRFLEIAFSEELKILCDEHGLSFGELRSAINTKWNVELLEARSGIGGHCLPKDSQMYLNLAKGILEESLLDTAKMVDKKYKLHIGLDKRRVALRSELLTIPQVRPEVLVSGNRLAQLQKTQQGEAK